MRPGIRLRSLRLDSAAIEKAIGRRASIALTRYGSISRRHARKSIKTVVPPNTMLQKGIQNVREGYKRQDWRKFNLGKKQQAAWGERRLKGMQAVSPAGGYPYSHTRSKYATIRNIQYHYDPQRKGVVIGPITLGRGVARVPPTLEYGVTAMIYERAVDQRTQGGSFVRSWLPTTAKAARGGGTYRKRMARIRKRPTMDLTYNAMRRQQTLEQSIIYADKKLGGK